MQIVGLASWRARDSRAGPCLPRSNPHLIYLGFMRTTLDTRKLCARLFAMHPPLGTLTSEGDCLGQVNVRGRANWARVPDCFWAISVRYARVSVGRREATPDRPRS